MKNTIFVFLILIFPFSGKSQSYQSLFGLDSTMWTELYEIIDGAETRSYQTITGFDSTFNSHNYKKVFDGLQPSGLIREDTVTGKVWYYSIYSQTERTIMDLSLQLNDSFMIYTFWNDSIPVVVDSVYFMNGLKHVRFNFNVLSYQRKLEFIEGTGPNAGITYQGETQGWNYVSQQLLCKYTDSTKVYINVDFNGLCYIFLIGINEFKNESKSVAFPNPVNRNEWLNIKNDSDPVQSIQLFNLLGNFICRVNAYQMKMTQPAGIYFIDIIHLSGKIERLKVSITN